MPVLIALSDMSCNTVHWSSFTIQFTKKRYVKRFLLMFLLYIFEIRMLLTKSQYKCLYAIYTRLQLSTATNKRLHVNATNMRLRILPTCKRSYFCTKPANRTFQSSQTNSCGLLKTPAVSTLVFMRTNWIKSGIICYFHFTTPISPAKERYLKLIIFEFKFWTRGK